jgi:hypothetical protein
MQTAIKDSNKPNRQLAAGIARTQAVPAAETYGKAIELTFADLGLDTWTDPAVLNPPTD